MTFRNYRTCGLCIKNSDPDDFFFSEIRRVIICKKCIENDEKNLLFMIFQTIVFFAVCLGAYIYFL